MKKIFITLISATLLFSYANAGEDKKAKPDRKAMKSKHMEVRMDKMLAKVDADKNGQVSKDEFMNAHAMKFKEMDKDNNGSLSREELKNAHMDKKDRTLKKIRKHKKDRKH